MRFVNVKHIEVVRVIDPKGHNQVQIMLNSGQSIYKDCGSKDAAENMLKHIVSLIESDVTGDICVQL